MAGALTAMVALGGATSGPTGAAPPQREAAEAATAGDWPELFGPGRLATVVGTDLFAGAPPRLAELWRRPLGKGYSAISVARGRAYTMVSDGADDYAVALDAARGRELWRARLDATYRGHGGSDDGPTSTPTVTAEAVYVVSPRGKLFALDPGSGKTLWRHDLVVEYGAVAPTWSFATSPLVDGRRLIVQVGGVGPNNLMAFDRASGEAVWSVSRATRLGYSSPARAEIAGVRQVVVAGEDQIYAVRPEDGELLWHLPADQSTKLMPVPLPGGRLFVPSWGEAMMLAIERGEGGGRFAARVEWTSPHLKGSYSPTVYHRGHLYGFNGGFVTCLDPATGKPVWRERAGEGSLILVDGHLVTWSQGALRLALATPEGYRELRLLELGRDPIDGLIPPSFAAGRVYLRPHTELLAVALTPGAEGPAAPGPR